MTQHASPRRRDLLRYGGAVAGGAAALTLAPLDFARAEGAAGGTGEETRTVSGRLETGAPDFVYVPVRVPRGVRRIAVSYTYDRPQVPAGTPGNALDIGVFDERGTALGGDGFRGWSGGFRTEFAISAEEATPGYLAGPVNAGTWHVVLGPYTVAPAGLDWRLTVTLTYGEAGRTPRTVYPPERAAGRGRAWYRGDGHLHTVHSDGRRTPEELVSAARAAGLDFIVTTEHNTSSAHGAFAALAGDDLLVLCGEEVTTRNGHFLALGVDPGTFVDWRYRARDDAYARYARLIHRAGGLVVPAHTHATCIGCSWRFGFREADAVEVWNGPWTADDELALASWEAQLGPDGGRLPAMGNSDAHREGQDVGLPQTVVLADGLDRRSLLDGIRAGRSYLAESAAVSASLTVTDERGRQAGIGGRLDAPAGTRITVRLDAAGVPGGTLRLLSDQGLMRTAPLPADGAGRLEWHTTVDNAAYVRGEVRHGTEATGAMAALTNPVFIGGTSGR